MNGIELHDVLAGDDRGVKTPAAAVAPPGNGRTRHK